MRQNIIFVLTLISLSTINAGVIRDEHICYNKDGKEIPCKKFISRKEDFGIKSHSKRNWSNGNGQFNLNNWLNRNRFNDLNIKNAINQSKAANYNSNNYNSNNYNSNNYNSNNYNSNIYNSNNYNSNYNTNNYNTNNYNTNNYNSNNYNSNNYNSNSNNNWYNNLSLLLNSLYNSYNSNFNTNSNVNSNSNTNSNNNNNWWSNWINQSNENNWWKFGNWWNSDNTSGTFNTDVRIVSNDNVIVSTKISHTIGSKTTTKVNTKEHRTTKALPTTTTSAPTQAPTQDASVNSNSPVNLPIKAFTMTRFNNCSEEQAKILESLIEDIKTYRAASVYLLDNQDEDETYKKIFLKYFKNENTYSKVKETFYNINSMPSATAYCEPHYDEACASGAMAWTYLDSKEFHVCPSLFEDAMFGTISKRSSEAASIVLHELTHCHGTDDYAYGERGANALPASQASNNADTYRLFSMSSIYYLNEKYHGLTKRDDDFLNESIDFRSEPFKDKVVVRPSLGKRNDDFLNESIDFRSEPFKNKVVIRPVLGKRGDDFLSETIDFRSEPFKDAVRVRPNPNQQ